MSEQVISVPFNRIFREVNGSRHRYRVLKGSAGSGKSFNLAQDYIIKLSDPAFKGANLLVARKVDDSNKYSTFAELCGAVYRIFGSLHDRYWKITRNPLGLQSLVTGNQIIFRGMADERQRERVKSITFPGGKLTWIWCEEATELEEDFIEILDDRLRGELPNTNLYYQMTFSFNPVSSSHWIKRRFFDTASEDVITNHSTYLDNRFCDAAYHRRMMDRKERDPDGYQVYGLGEWGELGGLIFTNYEVHDFETDEEYFDAMAIGQDFGYNHANAILVLGIKDGEIYVCSEIYLHEHDAEQIIEIAKKRGLPDHLKMWCDSAEPGTIKTWRRVGGYRRAEAVEKEKGCVRAQIDWLKARKIHIHPSCLNTVKEIQSWKWTKNKQTGMYEDEPVSVFDDAMAALRYGIERWRKSALYNRSR